MPHPAHPVFFGANDSGWVANDGINGTTVSVVQYKNVSPVVIVVIFFSLLLETQFKTSYVQPYTYCTPCFSFFLIFFFVASRVLLPLSYCSQIFGSLTYTWRGGRSGEVKKAEKVI